MKFNSDIHHRHSIRLKDYDYAKTGLYFVTIVTQYRESLLGEVVGGAMVLNNAGRAIHDTWRGLPGYYPGVRMDAFIVMPNHIHGIVALNVGAPLRGCPSEKAGQAQRPDPTFSLPDVIHRFKTFTTFHYSKCVINEGWRAFPGRLWQRNYFERIIRNQDELQATRYYVDDNPRMWVSDEENPAVAEKNQ